MTQIAKINKQLTANPLGGTSTDASTAALLDQRDQYITQLSQLMDIRVITNGGNQVTVFTASGVQLVGNRGGAACRSMRKARSRPNTQWNADPSKSNLGSVVSISYTNGGSIDLTAAGAIKSGTIAAYTGLARQDAGRGAEPARSVRSIDVERAVGQDDGGQRIPVDVPRALQPGRRPASTLAGSAEAGNVIHCHLYGYRDQYAARSFDHARR